MVGEAELEFVRRAYLPVEQGGLARPSPGTVLSNEVLSGIDPEIEWLPAMTGSADGHAYHGHEGVEQWSSEMADVFEQMRAEVHEVVPMGDDQVVAIVSWRLRGRGSADEQTIQVGHLWTFLGGRAVRMEAFMSEDDALAAAED